VEKLFVQSHSTIAKGRNGKHYAWGKNECDSLGFVTVPTTETTKDPRYAQWEPKEIKALSCKKLIQYKRQNTCSFVMLEEIDPMFIVQLKRRDFIDVKFKMFI